MIIEYLKVNANKTLAVSISQQLILFNSQPPDGQLKGTYVTKSTVEKLTRPVVGLILGNTITADEIQNVDAHNVESFARTFGQIQYESIKSVSVYITNHEIKRLLVRAFMLFGQSPYELFSVYPTDVELATLKLLFPQPILR